MKKVKEFGIGLLSGLGNVAMGIISLAGGIISVGMGIGGAIGAITGLVTAGALVLGMFVLGGAALMSVGSLGLATTIGITAAGSAIGAALGIKANSILKKNEKLYHAGAGTVMGAFIAVAGLGFASFDYDRIVSPTPDEDTKTTETTQAALCEQLSATEIFQNTSIVSVILEYEGKEFTCDTDFNKSPAP